MIHECSACHEVNVVLATDKKDFDPAPDTTAARLMENREAILVEWVNRVKRFIPSTQNEHHPILINTLPALLENLAEALAPNYPRELATDGSTIATEHGGERARLTRISPNELIQEHQILRDTIFDILGANRPLDHRDTQIIVKSIDQAMGESLIAYFLVHEGIREQFSLTLTHDLRNPLTSIKSSADLLLRNLNRPEQISKHALRITDNVLRIDRMIQDLLDASRISFGEKIQYEVTKCDLLSVVERAVAQFKPAHGDRFIIEGAPIQGYWNGDAFQRAVENLLGNAIKYGDATSPIWIRMEDIHGRAILSVRNEGPPIPKEEQEGVFRSFMRSRAVANGTKRGWGIGLAMVRGMAEGHGGSITVDSAPERGTTFVIDVPVDARPFLEQPRTPGT